MSSLPSGLDSAFTSSCGYPEARPPAMTSLAPRMRASTTDDSAAPVAALFDEHCDFVCRVLRHLGVHDSTLDDAVQDVFVTAYRRWSTFEGRSSARSWLYGIARRIASRYRRSADTRARRIATEDPPAEGIDEPFARVHAAQSLATLLGRIDQDKRAVFVLTELEGMTAPEVAEALGIPVGTAYSRLRAAWSGLGREAERERERLRRRLQAMRPSPPSDARRRRMWGLVAGGLGPPSAASPTAASTGWWVHAKWLVVGAALGAGAWGARSVISTDPPPPTTVPAAVANSAPPPRPNAFASSPSTDTAPSLPESPTPSISNTGPRSATTSPRSRAHRSTPSPPNTPPSDTLTAELSLVQRARRATSEGRGRAALELLDEHERRYPRGQLADERRLARIDALCAAGRHDDATDLARTLGRDPSRVCP